MKKHLTSLLVGGSLLAVFISGILRSREPFWNWDMLPYMAAAAELDGANATESHALAYAEAAANVPEEEHHWLIDPDNPYRAALKDDAAAFADQMPFYWIKPFYIALVWAFWKCGLSLAWSTVLPSFISSLLLGAALIVWLRRTVPVIWSPILGAVFMALPCVNEVAGLSTPDALSAALIVSGILMLHASDPPVTGVALLLLSIAGRLDNAIIVFVLIALQRWILPRRKLSTPWILAGGALTFGAYFMVNAMGCSHGWCVRPVHSFIPRSLHPQLETVRLSPELYLAALRKGSAQLKFTWVVEFASLAVLAMVVIFTRLRGTTMPASFRILIAVTGAMMIRYLLFPVPDDRALLPWYATITVFAAEVAHQSIGRCPLTTR